MNSINVNFVAGFMKSKATGTSINSAVVTPIETSVLSLTGSSTGTGASEIDNAYKQSRTLAPSTSEDLDMYAFENMLSEDSQAITECRLIYVVHLSTSAASSIVVGNAGSVPFLPFGMSATNTFTLKPGEGFIFFAQSTTAMTVSTSYRNLKVANSDAVSNANYEVGWFGCD